MIRWYRYLLSALLCAALLLTPVWAIGEEDDEESLRWLLSYQTEQESFDYFFYGDYDGDGVHEAFALVGDESGKSENPSGTLWFVSPKCVNKIDEERSYGAMEAIGEDGNKLFSAEEWYGGSGSVCWLWQVSRGEPKKVENKLDGSIAYAGDGVFLAYITAFDMCSDGTGHTWKPYYYFLDDDGLHEYGGISLSLDQLLTLDGAFDILQQKQANGWAIDAIIYRGNDIINVNMHDSSGSLTWYDNLTLRREGDRVVDTGENYGGVYELASTPSIAVYPSKFVEGSASAKAEDSALKLVCASEGGGLYSVSLQKGFERLWLDHFPKDYPQEYYDFSLSLYRLQNGGYFIYSGFESSSYRVVTFENGHWKTLRKIKDPNYSDGAALTDPDTGEELYYISNDEMSGDAYDRTWMNGILNDLFAEDGISFDSDGMQVSGELLLKVTGKQLLSQAVDKGLEVPDSQGTSSQEKPSGKSDSQGTPPQEKPSGKSDSQEKAPDSSNSQEKASSQKAVSAAKNAQAPSELNLYRFCDLNPQNVARVEYTAKDGVIDLQVILQDGVYGISDTTMNMTYFRTWSTVSGVLSDVQADLDGDGQDERIVLYSEYLTDESSDYTRESVIIYENVGGTWARQDEFIYGYDAMIPYGAGAQLRLVHAPDGMRLARMEWGAMDGGRYLAKIEMFAYDGTGFYRSEIAEMDDRTASFFFKGRIPMDIYAEMRDAGADSEAGNEYEYLNAHCEGSGTLLEHRSSNGECRTEGFEGVGALLKDYGLEVVYSLNESRVEEFEVLGGDELFSISKGQNAESGADFIRIRMAADSKRFAEAQNAVSPDTASSSGFDSENAPLIREDECEIQWSSARAGNKYDVRGGVTVDGRLDTAWNTNDAGVGEWISFTASDARQLAGFRIVNGYAKNKEVYSKNARARTLALYCDGQLIERFELEDHCALQTFWLAQPAIGTSFQWVVDQIYDGSRYRDLCITEIELLGVNNEDFHTHTLSDWGKAVEMLSQQLDAGGSLRKGDSGYEVMGLQLLLERGFGLLDDAADGTFGRNTESALISLQDLLRASSVSAQLEPMRNGVADGAFIRNLSAYLENQ